MTGIVLRTLGPALAAALMVLSLLVLLGGTGLPAGGLLGGTIAAAGLAVLTAALGADRIRRTLAMSPMTIAGGGLMLAVAAGAAPLLAGAPFLAEIARGVTVAGDRIALSSALVFDIGVYAALAGTLAALILDGEEA